MKKGLRKMMLVAALATAVGGSIGCSWKFEFAFNQPKAHKVTLRYNDGSNRMDEVLMPAGGRIEEYAIYPTIGYNEIVSWSERETGEPFDGVIKGDAVLYAQWQPFEPVVYTSEIPTNLRDEFVEISLQEGVNDLSGKIIYISRNVKSVFFKSDGAIYEDTVIRIDPREEDLTINFDNVQFRSKTYGNAISYEGDGNFWLNINVSGECGLDCSQFEPKRGESGADCINAPKVKLWGDGALSLMASNGYTGLKGTLSHAGGSGTDGGSGIVAKTVRISDITLNITAGAGGSGGVGYDGISSNSLKERIGGSGGAGGNGGNAIETKRFYANDVIFDFTAGKGGAGGRGGNGGGNILASGKGGNGGKGGDGGCVFLDDMVIFEELHVTSKYVAGNAGMGGQLGAGKGITANGKNGKSGANGKVNDKAK